MQKFVLTNAMYISGLQQINKNGYTEINTNICLTTTANIAKKSIVLILPP